MGLDEIGNLSDFRSRYQTALNNLRFQHACRLRRLIFRVQYQIQFFYRNSDSQPALFLSIKPE